MSTPTNYMAYRRKSAIFNNSQDHLWGIRAILAVQSFAWLFFKVFNSTLTVPGPNPTLRVDQPTATPSAVPGVFGGPGIVARDFMGQNISESNSTSIFVIQRYEFFATLSNGEVSVKKRLGKATRQSRRRNIGRTSGSFQLHSGDFDPNCYNASLHYEDLSFGRLLHMSDSSGS